jgi:hypothetical protein
MFQGLLPIFRGGFAALQKLFPVLRGCRATSQSAETDLFQVKPNQQNVESSFQNDKTTCFASDQTCSVTKQVCQMSILLSHCAGGAKLKA